MKRNDPTTKIGACLLQLGAACFMLLFSSACAHYAIDDAPLSQWTPERDRESRMMAAGERSSKMLVLVAFSGGGTRAASFAYGVLQELAETEVNKGVKSPFDFYFFSSSLSPHEQTITNRIS